MAMKRLLIWTIFAARVFYWTSWKEGLELGTCGFCGWWLEDEAAGLIGMSSCCDVMHLMCSWNPTGAVLGHGYMYLYRFFFPHTFPAPRNLPTHTNTHSLSD